MPVFSDSQPAWPAKFFLLFVILLPCFTLLAGYWLNSVWAWSAGIIYLLYDVLLLLYIVWSTRKLEPQNTASFQQKTLSVGIVIPARNEAQVLPACLHALLKSRLAPTQIILVDDGSTDHTALLLEQQFGLAQTIGVVQSSAYPGLQVLRQTNQGKASALNAGYPLLHTDIIVTLDADTLLSPDALGELVQAFQQQENLVAAGGVIVPLCNKSKPSLLTSFFEYFQKFEYIFSFLSRAAWMQANSLLLISGAFAAYRKEILHELGGFAKDSLVEDYEINHRLYRYAYQHHKAWKIGVIGSALATTDAPRTFKTFFHQRRRWFAGFLQTQFNYFDMVANRKYGAVGSFMLPIKTIDAIQPFIGAISLGLLIYFFIAGKTAVLWIILWVFASKLLVDLIFNLWGATNYYRWTARPMHGKDFVNIIMASLLAPFSFQFLRLFSACLGWWIFIRKRQDWLQQRGS